MSDSSLLPIFFLLAIFVVWLLAGIGWMLFKPSNAKQEQNTKMTLGKPAKATEQTTKQTLSDLEQDRRWRLVKTIYIAFAAIGILASGVIAFVFNNYERCTFGNAPDLSSDSIPALRPTYLYSNCSSAASRDEGVSVILVVLITGAVFLIGFYILPKVYVYLKGDKIAHEADKEKHNAE